MTYNIYFGTIGNTLSCKYRFSAHFKNEEDAKKTAYEQAVIFYNEHEGEYGIPSFETLMKESNTTNTPISTLYDDHVNDMMRWYAIPTDVDTIPSKELNWKQ
jgi:hypothetical protein